MSTRRDSAQGDLSGDGSEHLLPRRRDSRHETLETTHGDGDDRPALAIEEHGQHAGPPAGAPPASPSHSVFSYDSLEELPDQEPGQPQVTAKPSSKKRRRKRLGSWLPRSIWMTEIWSCVLAASCLAAIIGILSAHEGLPLPQWPWHITINALVSVFTAIFKMALMTPVAEGRSTGQWHPSGYALAALNHVHSR